MVVCYLPAFYALQYLPPDRVLIVNWFLCVAPALPGASWPAAWRRRMLLDCCAASRRPPGWLGAVVIVLLLIIPAVSAAQRALAAWPSLWRYTSTWDSEEQMLLLSACPWRRRSPSRLVTPGQIDNLSDSPSSVNSTPGQLLWRAGARDRAATAG